MTESTPSLDTGKNPPMQSPLKRLGRLWARVSPSLVPVFAVITALIAIIPLMVLTQGRGNLQRGFDAAGETYAGLLEGALGLSFNQILSPNDVNFALEFVQSSNAVSTTRINAQNITTMARRAEDLVILGRDNVAYYAQVIDQYLGTDFLPDNQAFHALGEAIPDIQRIGTDRLRDYGALVDDWAALNSVDVRRFGTVYGELTELDEDTRLYLEALMPDLITMDDEAILGAFRLLQDYPFAQLIIQIRNVRAGEITEAAEEMGIGALESSGDVLMVMEELRSTGALNAFINRYGLLDALDSESRTQIENLVPAASDYSDDQLIDAIRLLRDRSLIRLRRALDQLRVLDQIGLDVTDADAQAIATIYQQSTDRSNPTGITNVQRVAEAEQMWFIPGGVDEGEIPRLAAELRLVANLYNGVLSLADVERALTEELPQAVESRVIIRRPNSQVMVLEDQSVFGMIERQRTRVVTAGSGAERVTTTQEVTVPDRLFARVFGNYVLFSPSGLEQTLTRSLPFIIAGLAVALGFKSGLFNIGAEGQLYIGATLAAWFGFSPLFTMLPAFLHIPLVLLGGIIGGALWGLIPGMLKAYTGAHEVINTIMLNFIAIRLTDWLIKSTNPYILGDPDASVPRTPFLVLNARLTKFDQIGTTTFLIAAIFVAVFYIFMRYSKIQKNPRYLIRPVMYGVLVFFGGIALRWLTVAGNLHIGLVVMLLAVIFVDWFLERTKYGFELRTVGANADAAKYAGMNVRRNIILAMVLSGGLAGLAGIVEIGGVQYSMEPAFFSGLGFDAIAIALLARNNPRNMIPAGILWGALVTGASAIQVYGIPIDLIKIIQALIIMFIAADAIIRVIYRVPEATPEEKAKMIFSTGWGS
jgi:ABC-type uncharacterized transport system permease subunit